MPSPLLVTRDGPVAHVRLNRPEVRNALDETLVAALADWARSARDDSTLRAAVLGGEGTVFCAGADLAWMARARDFTRDENLRDAAALAAMFEALDTLPVPLVGRIQGAALGGGVGLAAVCDIVVADAEAVFGFTEVRLGIAPSVIAPFVLRRIGVSAARALFLTGARFSAARAREIGLVHAVVQDETLDVAIEGYLSDLLAGGPAAIAAAKRLISDIHGRTPADVRETTAALIASLRVSPEGQEGLRAFLERRQPAWRVDRGGDRR